MHIESFHRLVKVVYLHQKQNRRIDALLSVLLKLSRDKAFERLQKLEKGKNSYRVSEINKRHRNAEQLDKESINAISSNHWAVKSQEREVSYTVERLQDLTCSDTSCYVKCTQCGVCPHMYKCTCIDCLLHNTACKHIHLVHMQQVQVSSKAVDKEMENYSTAFNQYRHATPSIGHGNASEALLSACKELELLIPKIEDTNAIQHATKSMRSVISLLKGTLSGDKIMPLQPKSNYAPNSNNKKQLMFHSTKKRDRLLPIDGLNLPQMKKC